MSTHTIHDDIELVGLVDGCPRCEEHAKDPLMALDTANLRTLIDRVVHGDGARSTNEARAMGKIRDDLNRSAALAKVSPVLFAKFLKDHVNGVQFVAVVGK